MPLSFQTKSKIPHASSTFSLKYHVRETLLNSAANATLKAIETPYLSLRIFLITCVTASLSASAFLVIQAFITYFTYGVSTTSRTLYETPAFFPKITICNVNQFTSEYAYEFVRSVNKRFLPTVDIFDRVHMSRYNMSEKTRLINFVHARAIYSMNNLSDVDKCRLARSLDQTLLSCEFNNQACTHADFTWLFHPVHGNCYEFNANSAKR
jgi:hypothetical protein